MDAPPPLPTATTTLSTLATLPALPPPSTAKRKLTDTATPRRRRNNIPAFVTALHDRLLVPGSNKCIYWLPNEKWLVIDRSNPDLLAQVLTDKRLGGFKSAEWSAVTRQLDNYGFRKVTPEELSLVANVDLEGKVAFTAPENYTPFRDDAKWILVAAKDRKEAKKENNLKLLQAKLQELSRENNRLQTRLWVKDDTINKQNYLIAQLRSKLYQLTHAPPAYSPL